MLKRYEENVADMFRLSDACVVVAAWLASYPLRFFYSPFDVTKGLPRFGTYAALAPLVGVLWMAVFTWMRVYELRRTSTRAAELLLILKAHGVAVLLFIAFTYAFEDYRYSRIVMAYFAVLGATGVCGLRVVIRSALRRMRARGVNLRVALAIGEGSTLSSIVEHLRTYPELGLRVGGVITHESSTTESVGGASVLGAFQEISSIVRSRRCDEVIISLPPSQQHELDRILEQLKDEMVDVRVVPDVHRYVTIGCEVESFVGFPVVRLNDSPLIGRAALAKRVTDGLISAIALLVLSPLLLLIAMLVKLTSRGPVIYAQERMGLDGRTFRMLKFRSMRVDAEATTGAVWCRERDDRRTPIGAFLRKTSLDELPQFWNVLCGDMSLVGPRPERPVFVQKFRGEVSCYMLRHKVKSGITGWAQINGWRGNTPLEGRIACDLFYIRNWSYALDLKILLLTIWKGFVNRNAY
jgi:Undecaprenyl-phosphate glucose phosphotransferase